MNWIFGSLPLLLFIMLTWIALGQLIVRRAFKLQDGFTVSVLSLPCGLIGYLFFVNALSYVIYVPISVWIVNIGVWVAMWFFRRRPQLPLEWDMDLRTRRILAAGGAAVFVFFFMLNAREVWLDTDGLASMVQLLANGEFPLRFQCNPAEVSGYQYGGNLIAAAVVDTAALTSWDSQDVLVGYQMVCLCGLILLIIRRRTKSLLAGVLGIYIILTVGHIVWLLLPLTGSGLGYIGAATPQSYELVYMMDSLTMSPWTYGVVTPGFLTPPLIHAHRTFSWTFGPLTILLFLALLDTPFISRWMKTIVLGYVLGTVSLLQPSGLLILAPGFAMLTLLSVLRPKRFSLDINPWVVIALSLVVAVMQGGIITDVVRSRLEGTANTSASFSLRSLTLPSCPSEANNFSCTVLSFANMGLIPFLLPMFAAITLQGRKDNAQTVLVFGALSGYLVPILFSYGYIDWNLLRSISFTSWTLAVFMTPWLYRHIMAGGRRRWLAVLFIVVATYGGVVTTWVMVDGRWINDAKSIDFSPMIPANDLEMMTLARRLPLDALIFDPKPCKDNTASRPAYVFGRYTRSSINRSQWLIQPADYSALLSLPTADGMRAAGYTHVYVDHVWYYGLTQEGKDALRLGNYESLSASGDARDFRILLRVCAPDEQCVANPDAFPESLTSRRANRDDAD